MKYKSENMILLSGKSYPHDPIKVNKGKNRKPHHIFTPNKNHRRISCNPVFASTYSNPPAKSVSNYYNLACYNSGLITIQLPHPSTKKQVDDLGVMFKMHDTWNSLLINLPKQWSVRLSPSIPLLPKKKHKYRPHQTLQTCRIWSR